YGELVWRAAVEPPIATRVIANETHFFFGSGDGRFYAHEKKNPYLAWQHVTGGAIYSSPIIAGDQIVFGSLDGKVYSVTQERGWVKFDSWTTATGARVTADVAQHSRWIFAGSEDYKLYCIEATDGSVYWSFVAEAPIRDAPVVYTYRPNEEYAFCIASRGSIANPTRTLFAVRVPRSGVAPAAVAEWRRENVVKVVGLGRDCVYVLDDPERTGAKTISALDVRTGKQKFQIPVDRFHFVPTNLADATRTANQVGVIYLVARVGSMQAIREKR